MLKCHSFTFIYLIFLSWTFTNCEKVGEGGGYFIFHTIFLPANLLLKLNILSYLKVIVYNCRQYIQKQGGKCLVCVFQRITK